MAKPTRAQCLQLVRIQSNRPRRTTAEYRSQRKTAWFGHGAILPFGCPGWWRRAHAHNASSETNAENFRHRSLPAHRRITRPRAAMSGALLPATRQCSGPGHRPVRTIDFGYCVDCFIEIPGAHACLAFSVITDLASQLGNLARKRGVATCHVFLRKTDSPAQSGYCLDAASLYRGRWLEPARHAAYLKSVATEASIEHGRPV